MAEIVNLKREKKRRARADAAQLAAENRVRFGRTKGEKLVDAQARERDEVRHAQGKLRTDMPETE